ncbi:hypothetical protein RGV33_18430 [Pseudomonas sp. Bout1]|nr:hypothetical protein [Pseudomonas sp. Bout1]MDY7533638.1 hypothetical protein [Pseudomonas sp. Bout1]MEB0187463.1 hypothetical protein [Pseudomonas sp. Bout1]
MRKGIWPAVAVRKALPALEIGQLHSQDYLAPRNELEQTLAGIWAEVLKVERAGVQGNFFELGDVRVQHGGGIGGVYRGACGE